MAIKVGTDIIDTTRVQSSIEKFGDKFLNRFLNDEEKKLAKKVETIAGFWASKEAISKALGCGIGKELEFKDIIIKKDSLSISHDGNFAIAVVVVILKGTSKNK